MTIYVDALIAWPQKATSGGRYFGSGKLSCHMWTDGTLSELLTFAQSIGLRREWLQTKRTDFLHFDLTPSKRILAVRAGAQEVDLKDWLRERMERRNVRAE